MSEKTETGDVRHFNGVHIALVCESKWRARKLKRTHTRANKRSECIWMSEWHAFAANHSIGECCHRLGIPSVWFTSTQPRLAVSVLFSTLKQRMFYDLPAVMVHIGDLNFCLFFGNSTFQFNNVNFKLICMEYNWIKSKSNWKCFKNSSIY